VSIGEQVAGELPTVELPTLELPTVVLADDHAAVRAGVRLALELGGFKVVAEATTADDAVAAALRDRPSLCLLDIYMPGGGIAAAERIAASLPDTAIVMLTVSSSEQDLFAALRAGASGYLLKTTDPERLPLELHGVLRGDAALPRALTTRLIEEFRRRGRLRRLPLAGRIELTDREVDVLELLRQGHSTMVIAQRLGISVVTVRRHISAMMAKFNVRSRDAMLEALDRRERRE
jgi:two-component system NarL family response regulator